MPCAVTDRWLCGCCRQRPCPLCAGGYVATGLTAGQVDGIVRERDVLLVGVADFIAGCPSDDARRLFEAMLEGRRDRIEGARQRLAAAEAHHRREGRG